MAHTVDVDALAAHMSLELFDEWLAYFRIEPWGDDWEQAGTVAAMAWNAGLVAGGYIKDPPGYKLAGECVPYKARPSSKPAEREIDPVALAAVCAARFGPKE